MPLGQALDEPPESDAPPVPEPPEPGRTPEPERRDWFSEIGRWRADVNR